MLICSCSCYWLTRAKHKVSWWEYIKFPGLEVFGHKLLCWTLLKNCKLWPDDDTRSSQAVALHLFKISRQSTNSFWDISVTNRLMDQSTDGAILGAILIMWRLRTSIISVDFVHRLLKAQSSGLRQHFLWSNCQGLRLVTWKILVFLTQSSESRAAAPEQRKDPSHLHPLYPHTQSWLAAYSRLKRICEIKQPLCCLRFPTEKDMRLNQHITSWFGPCPVFPPESWL